jgi:hypothetical protein
MKGGICRCGSGCCCSHQSVPDKTMPINRGSRSNDTSASAKLLSPYSVAFASNNSAAGSTSSMSRREAAVLLIPPTLQAQGVRLQI